VGIDERDARHGAHANPIGARCVTMRACST
jgi:hypothetical protein